MIIEKPSYEILGIDIKSKEITARIVCSARGFKKKSTNIAI